MVQSIYISCYLILSDLVVITGVLAASWLDVSFWTYLRRRWDVQRDIQFVAGTYWDVQVATTSYCRVGNLLNKIWQKIFKFYENSLLY